MSSRVQRTKAVRAEPVTLKSRAAAWDQVAPSELAFDFSVRTPATVAPDLEWSEREKAGVKESIIRWLEGQL